MLIFSTKSSSPQPKLFIPPPSNRPVPNISPGLRSEFARGDGRVKQLEEDRRRRIQPSETLFVVNFHEETTKREDLEMLFDPFGEIVRIEMKRNYAFVQFRTIEQATRAKEAVNGGKLDQSYLTVEYVAQQRGRDGGGGGRRGGNDRRGPRDGGRRYDDRGGGRRDDRRRDDYQRDRYDDRRHDDRRSGGGGGYDDRRRQSPPRYSSYRGRSSRSRSPPRRYRSRSRSPDRYNDRGGRYDDRGGGSSGGGGGYSGGGGGGGRDRSPEPYRGRGRSPDRDRGGGGGGFDRRDRDDRGYRP
uniref:RRM domain-containing protein n=1 Tax=Grammatophora oceanica TaxID=210454 RepID=A0A7S1YJG1_9STRA|mmetsp:Transcript_5951/g.8463  ORF Transcript_5951/g.8463 Transcript_5951/m.8463 type:complete len:299 (+) Transcript_5951:777-1673(+)